MGRITREVAFVRVQDSGSCRLSPCGRNVRVVADYKVGVEGISAHAVPQSLCVSSMVLFSDLTDHDWANGRVRKAERWYGTGV